MTTLSGVLCFVLLLVCSIAWAEDVQEGLASGFPNDVGIAEHPAVIFASGFENGFDGWTLDARDRRISSIVNDPALAHSGNACCRSVAIRGKTTGGNVTHYFPEGLDKVYLRFHCRFDKDAVIPHHFVKIRALRPGFSGNAGKRPPGDKGFWTGIEPVRNRTWDFYTYWHKMRASRAGPTEAESVYYGNRFTAPGQTPIEREKWICVEAMLKANTVGKSDGEQAFWIDGKLIGWWKPGSPVGSWVGTRFVTADPQDDRPVGPFEGFDFRSDPTLTINQIALQWYVTERYAARGTSDRNIVYFDDVVIATEYIGPMKKAPTDAAPVAEPPADSPAPPEGKPAQNP